MRIARIRAPIGTSGVAMLTVAFLAAVAVVLAVVLAADRGLDVSAQNRYGGEGYARDAVIMIQVRADGGLIVDGRKVAPDRLADTLRTKVDPGSRPAMISRPVLLRPDGDAVYGVVVDALDELRQVRTTLRLGRELRVSLGQRRESEPGASAVETSTPR
jgi:biopolymer transport protein ExbD